ncbi:hypothetical protein YQE_00883, partial [Dendroctonus ponderosae]
PAAPRPQPAKHVEPPPSTITLRPAAPISQTPAPVYSAQPATASLKGGKNLRGDLKWPPENVRQRMAEEQAFIEEISKGPAVKPSRKERDYTPFFAQHALNSTYPGYKIPPGTHISYITELKGHGGWRSDTVAEGYIDDSLSNKLEVASKILDTQSLITQTQRDVQIVSFPNRKPHTITSQKPSDSANYGSAAEIEHRYVPIAVESC